MGLHETLDRLEREDRNCNCPKCGTECDRDSVDVEVGIIYGPWCCPECGWSSDPQLDMTDPKNQPVKDGRYTDQFGNSYSVDRIVENASRFGLGEAARKAFEGDR